ncbi:TRAP transporter large permease [Thauera sp.]|uniref:TRAP transporter large permease n=1 Tax=Thauera sp. TaxID=1905334 RepID=UPI0039E626BC
MIEFFTSNIAPIMFGVVMLFLLSGFPVAFSLAACGLVFGFVGIELGLLPATLFQALPLRVFGIMQNDTLLAIPFFTLMGLILERSGMAEDLLETAGQVFGPIRGGLALSVLFVGSLLAATTGVVAAAVISMGLISLPIMLRYGYNPAFSCGTITASGTLAQALPPSLVLIVVADQLGTSVGDMFRGAFTPAFMLIGAYALLIIAVAIFLPKLVPAMPPEARTFREADGTSGGRSLLVFSILIIAAAIIFGFWYGDILGWMQGTEPQSPARDETVVVAMTFGTILSMILAGINRLLRLGLLSRMAQQFTFVMVPPLALIFLVLGTIFLGVATPTEGGAMGATGALLMALMRRRLDLKTLRQALEATTRLSCFVLFILIGSTLFSFTFTAVDGNHWVEHLFDQLPGGEIGFLLFVNTVVFLLGFFLDFFEIAFILLPLLGPVAEKMGIDLIWFGILIAVNLQTSFLTPPFGFALLYLRSITPVASFIDRVTGKRMEGIRTGQMYRGALPFVFLQIVVLGLLIAFPQLITGSLDKAVDVDLDSIRIEAPTGGGDAWGSGGSDGGDNGGW